MRETTEIIRGSTGLRIVSTWNDLPSELQPYIPNLGDNRVRTTPSEYFWEPMEHVLFHSADDYTSKDFDYLLEGEDWFKIDWYGVMAAIQYVADGEFEERDEPEGEELKQKWNKEKMSHARQLLIKLFPDKVDKNGNPFGIPDPSTILQENKDNTPDTQ